MPRRRVCMRQIGEVLRLAAQHLSYDEIARSVGMSRTTSVYYVVRESTPCKINCGNRHSRGLVAPLRASLSGHSVRHR